MQPAAESLIHSTSLTSTGSSLRVRAVVSPVTAALLLAVRSGHRVGVTPEGVKHACGYARAHDCLQIREVADAGDRQGSLTGLDCWSAARVRGLSVPRALDDRAGGSSFRRLSTVCL